MCVTSHQPKLAMDECHGQHYSENTPMFFKQKRSVKEKKLQSSDSLPYLHQRLLRQLRRFKGDEPLQAGGRSPVRRVSQAGGRLCSQRGWPPAQPGWGAHTHAAACGAQGAPRAAGAHCKETGHGGSVPARCTVPHAAPTPRETQETRNEKHWSHWNIRIALILPVDLCTLSLCISYRGHHSYFLNIALKQLYSLYISSCFSTFS